MVGLDVGEYRSGEIFGDVIARSKALSDVCGGERRELDLTLFDACDADASDHKQGGDRDNAIKLTPSVRFVKDIGPYEQSEPVIGMLVLKVLERVEGVIGGRQVGFDVRNFDAA